MDELPKLSADTQTIAALVDTATSGGVRLPAFQRPFRWDAADIERLFDSLHRGYPIGSLLFWKRPAPREEVRFGPWHRSADERQDALWVVDGQQRLTSLVGVLARPDDADDPAFSLYFDLVTGRLKRGGSRTPPSDWLPLNRVLETHRMLDWLLDYQGRGGARARIAAANALAGRIREYEVPTYTVETDDERVLREIFDRLTPRASG